MLIFSLLRLLAAVDRFTGRIKVEPTVLARLPATRQGRVAAEATWSLSAISGRGSIARQDPRTGKGPEENLRTVVARCRRGHGPRMRAQEAADA
jgi:hypothetical protein